MKIQVKAKPGAKKESVERVDQPTLDLGPRYAGGFGEAKRDKNPMAVYKVSVKEPAKDGKANEAIRKALAVHFKVPVSRVIIKSGKTSKKKLIEII